MKKITFMLLVVMTLTGSCSKTLEGIVESAVSCTFDSIFLSIDANIDPENSKQVTFKVNNTSKDYTTGGVEWDFGDGNKKATNDSSITHTYGSSGNYELAATITLKKGSATCITKKDKDVTVD